MQAHQHGVHSGLSAPRPPSGYCGQSVDANMMLYISLVSTVGRLVVTGVSEASERNRC